MDVLPAVVTACAGFLIAVLWMDLMFDVQVLAHRRADVLPESVLTSIACYYRRVTTTARPMGHLIAAVMAIMLLALGFRAVSAHDPRWLTAVSAMLAVGPVLLALLRTVPNAVRLGKRTSSTVEQSRLARSVCADHLACLACESAFLAVWLCAL